MRQPLVLSWNGSHMRIGDDAAKTGRRMIRLSMKAVFQYSYFIHPIVIPAGKRPRFLEKLLADNAWRMNTGRDEADLSTQAYFLPYVRRLLFPTADWSDAFRGAFDRMPLRKRLAVAASLPSVDFDLALERSPLGKGPFTRAAIGVDITRITLHVFESGIGFLVIKTELDTKNGLTVSDVLDFNNRFRTMSPRYLKKRKGEGIAIRNKRFGDAGDLSAFISHLLYGFEDVETGSAYYDRLFTYSFLCLDRDAWNESHEMSEFLNEFYKFQHCLPSDYGAEFEPSYREVRDDTYKRWKYSLFGFSREAGVVLASACEPFNVTKLPLHFETMYAYILLLAFYQRLSLILFSEELLKGDSLKVDEMKRRFTRFTHLSWFSQITNSEHGMDLWKKWQKTFDLPALFEEVQKEYEEFYDYKVAKGQERINLLLIVIYVISVLFSALTLLVDVKALQLDSGFARLFSSVLLGGSVAAYPAYRLLQALVRRVRGMRRYRPK